MAVNPEQDPIEEEAERLLREDPELRKDLEEFGAAYDQGKVEPDQLILHDEVRRRIKERGVETPPPRP